MNNWGKKYLSIMIVSLMVVFSCVPMHAASQKIRVGFFGLDGYHMISSDGTKTGYGYDFLQLINRYADFDFEYVGYHKSWADMQQMLKEGKIDLLTSAQKTPDREKIFAFSHLSIE